MLNFLKWKKKDTHDEKDNITTLIDKAQIGQMPGDDIKRFYFSSNVVSDVGDVRTNNEDNYILNQYMNRRSEDYSEAVVGFSDNCSIWRIAGVFDGMGGGEIGEQASHDTAEIFIMAFQKMTDDKSKVDIDFIVRSAFLEANNRIVDLQNEFRVFGTTGTVMCTNGVEFKLYHLGDSRAYLIRDNELIQLTVDQTLAQMKMEVGMYNKDDPAIEEDKHKLTEYIGRDWTKENIKPIESLWISIEPGDNILLCSDGLYDMCSNEEILEIFRRRTSISVKSPQLVQAAISHGGEDNVTCVVVSFTE